MIFVPVVPPQPPSPRVRELAGLLGKVIEEYEKHHPAVTGTEIRQALEVASQSSSKAAPAAAVILGALAALLGAGVFAAVAMGGGKLDMANVPVVGAVVVALGIVMVAVLMRRLAGK